MDIRDRDDVGTESKTFATDILAQLASLTALPSGWMKFYPRCGTKLEDLRQLADQLGSHGWTTQIVPAGSWFSRWYSWYTGLPRGYELHVR